MTSVSIAVQLVFVNIFISSHLKGCHVVQDDEKMFCMKTITTYPQLTKIISIVRIAREEMLSHLEE